MTMARTRQREILSVLEVCEWCGVDGPRERLHEHIVNDHPELVGAEPQGPVRQPLDVELPGRFRNRLERLSQQSGRTMGQVVAAVLDAHGLGRQKRVPSA
jgi:hypothetical protein